MKASYKIALLITILLCSMVIIYYINQESGTEQYPVPADVDGGNKRPRNTLTNTHTTVGTSRTTAAEPQQPTRAIDMANAMLNPDNAKNQSTIFNTRPTPTEHTRQPIILPSTREPVDPRFPIDESVPKIVLDGTPNHTTTIQSPSTFTDPAPTPPAIPARKTPRQTTYTVQEGDTFSAIAIKLYGDDKYWVDIAQANPLVDPIRLRVGLELRLPQEGDLRELNVPQSNQVQEGQTRRYTIRSGDTLSTIAAKFYNDSSQWRIIFNANRDKLGGNPDRVQAGVTITIPDINGDNN